jgi:predicted nucleic acid-binding protein
VTRYLIDTTTLIDYARNREPVRGALARLLDEEDCAVCAVVVAEFMSGISPDLRPVWSSFFSQLEFWAADDLTAQQAGFLRKDLSLSGFQVSLAGALVAATARQHGAVLVTDNVRDFARQGVQTLSLRDGSQSSRA